MPDYEALLPPIPAMSLMESRRYLLADGSSAASVSSSRSPRPRGSAPDLTLF